MRHTFEIGFVSLVSPDGDESGLFHISEMGTGVRCPFDIATSYRVYTAARDMIGEFPIRVLSDEVFGGIPAKMDVDVSGEALAKVANAEC